MVADEAAYIGKAVDFDTFRQTLRQQGEECWLTDGTPQSAEAPRAMHLICRAFFKEAEDLMTR